MYNRVMPTNDEARLKFLQATVNAHEIDMMVGKQRLRTETATDVQSLLYQFQQAHATAQRCKERTKHARRLARERIDLLSGSLVSVWKLVRHRVQIGKLPNELLSHYGLPQRGPMPKPSERAGWLPLAAAAIEGHHAAVGNGLPVLDMSEVERELPDAQEAVRQLNTSMDALKDAQMQMRALRKEVTALAQAVSMELRRTLMEESAATRRAIMRSYGFAFAPDKAKTSENEATSLPEAGGSAGAGKGVASAD